jgi:hypothetical protein
VRNYLGINSDFDRRSETVAIDRSMTLGVPVADAALYLLEKVGAARIRQVAEVANEVCDRMLVALVPRPPLIPPIILNRSGASSA